MAVDPRPADHDSVSAICWSSTKRILPIVDDNLAKATDNPLPLSLGNGLRVLMGLLQFSPRMYLDIPGTETNLKIDQS